MTDCLLCGEPFTPTPRHPMVTSAWCPSCWRVIAERIAVVGLAQAMRVPVPAMRAEDV